MSGEIWEKMNSENLIDFVGVFSLDNIHQILQNNAELYGFFFL